MKKKYTKYTDFINHFHELINTKKLLLPNQKTLISISGGQDSTCLLVLILQLKNQWNLYFGSVWCNHLWQLDCFFTMKHISFYLSVSSLMRGGAGGMNAASQMSGLGCGGEKSASVASAVA